MAELCLSLLTKAKVPAAIQPLDRIWSMNHWLKSVPRVQGVEMLMETPSHQRFRLVFDAGRATFDHVEVERVRGADFVEVTHLKPPPDINSLKAKWWVEAARPDLVYARRSILIDENRYSPEVARKMFGVLRENVEALFGEDG